MILDDIIEYKRGEVEAAKKRAPLSTIRESLEKREPGSFRRAIGFADHICLIAEIKKASPSRGLLCEDFDPARLARIYASNGASAISVLTEARYFSGEPSHLREAKRASGLPVLRKDFIIDEYQVWETAAMGADALLLIVTALDEKRLSEFSAVATRLGLDALVEVHDRSQLETALQIGALTIGINNRDLKTFETDLQVTLELAPRIPRDRVIVSESGIHTGDDVARVRQAGVHAILVGEALVTSGDLPAKMRELTGGTG